MLHQYVPTFYSWRANLYIHINTKGHQNRVQSYYYLYIL